MKRNRIRFVVCGLLLLLGMVVIVVRPGGIAVTEKGEPLTSKSGERVDLSGLSRKEVKFVKELHGLLDELEEARTAMEKPVYEYRQYHEWVGGVSSRYDPAVSAKTYYPVQTALEQYAEAASAYNRASRDVVLDSKIPLDRYGLPWQVRPSFVPGGGNMGSFEFWSAKMNQKARDNGVPIMKDYLSEMEMTGMGAPSLAVPWEKRPTRAELAQNDPALRGQIREEEHRLYREQVLAEEARAKAEKAKAEVE